jgi:hypothetical protein
MIYQLLLFGLALTGLSLAVRAQEPAPTPVQIRAVLHDPINPVANLFYTDKTGAIVPLDFRPQDLTEPMFMLPIDGSLVLFDKANIDPKKPAESLAASAKLPLEMKRAIAVIIPSPSDQKPAYRMIIIDDSEKTFPHGESLVLSLVKVELAIEAGEHKLLIHPGKITRVPPVKKVNDYSMAQTNFHYQQNDSWVTFTERQLQYLDACRRLFIIHATPEALQPTVTTIVDVTGNLNPQ